MTDTIEQLRTLLSAERKALADMQATGPTDLLLDAWLKASGALNKASIEALPGLLDRLQKEMEASQLADRIAEVVQEDGGCWSACSGCQESVDGYVSSRDYPYSPIFKCQPGGGCGECGGLGVVWQDGDFLAGYGEAYLRELEPIDTAIGVGEE